MSQYYCYFIHTGS